MRRPGAAPMNPIAEYSYHATDPGAFRSENQDALISRPSLGVYAVADGAGGHRDGRWAANTVIDAIAAIPEGLPPSQRLSAIRQSIAHAHDTLRQAADECEDPRGAAATTVAVLLLEGDYFVVLWVGDSRVYLLRDGELIQLTHDHTLVQQMVDSGAIMSREGRNHPHANVITRAVGSSDPELAIDKRTGTVLPGDRFLLCSDGLLKTMDDDEICHALGQGGDVAAAMVATALRRRARDNVSAVVVVRP